MTPVTPTSSTPRMTETDLLRCVLDLARLYGWRSYHARPAMTAKGYRTAVQGDGKGFPDLLMVRGNHVLVAELKSDKGRLTEEQHEWLMALSVGTTVWAHVWRPAEWHDGTILRVLSGGREP